MYITRALIGRKTRVWIRPSKHGTILSESFLKWNFNTESCYFIKQLLYGFRVWMAWSKHLGMLQNHSPSARVRALFLTRNRTNPRVWIRPSKHGNHKVIVYSFEWDTTKILMNYYKLAVEKDRGSIFTTIMKRETRIRFCVRSGIWLWFRPAISRADLRCGLPTILPLGLHAGYGVVCRSVLTIVTGTTEYFYKIQKDMQ
jgi:hypothetical protein